MANTAKSTERASNRTVVLLRPSDRVKLQQLAARDNVSSGEVIRRSLGSYETLSDQVRVEEENKLMAATLALMSEAISEANRSIARTNAKLDKLHQVLKKKDIR